MEGTSRRRVSFSMLTLPAYSATDSVMMGVLVHGAGSVSVAGSEAAVGSNRVIVVGTSRRRISLSMLLAGDVLSETVSDVSHSATNVSATDSVMMAESEAAVGNETAERDNSVVVEGTIPKADSTGVLSEGVSDVSHSATNVSATDSVMMAGSEAAESTALLALKELERLGAVEGMQHLTKEMDTLKALHAEKELERLGDAAVTSKDVEVADLTKEMDTLKTLHAEKIACLTLTQESLEAECNFLFTQNEKLTSDLFRHMMVPPPPR